MNTLYAAHKYMCPGLAKKVVEYLKDNLTENNVLLVLQHICLFCYCGPTDGHQACSFWTSVVMARMFNSQQ